MNVIRNKLTWASAKLYKKCLALEIYYWLLICSLIRNFLTQSRWFITYRSNPPPPLFPTWDRGSKQFYYWQCKNIMFKIYRVILVFSGFFDPGALFLQGRGLTAFERIALHWAYFDHVLVIRQCYRWQWSPIRCGDVWYMVVFGFIVGYWVMIMLIYDLRTDWADTDLFTCLCYYCSNRELYKKFEYLGELKTFENVGYSVFCIYWWLKDA